MQKWERGTSPSAAFLAAIVEQTGCDAKWLLSGSGWPFPPGTTLGRTVDGRVVPVQRQLTDGGIEPFAGQFTTDGEHFADEHGRPATFGGPGPGWGDVTLAPCMEALPDADGTFRLADVPVGFVGLPQALAPRPELLTGIVLRMDMDQLSPVFPPRCVLIADCSRVGAVDVRPPVADRERIVVAKVKAPGERKPSLLFAGILSGTERGPLVIPPNSSYAPRTVRSQDVVGHVTLALLDLLPSPAQS